MSTSSAPLLEPFELAIHVQSSDIDALNHVNNVVYLRWVQEVATAHWQAGASKEDQERYLWVVARHEIDYKAPAFLGDQLVLRTWVGGASRVRFERHTEIRRSSDKVLIAKARTLWCPIDPATGRPALVPPETRTRFSTGEEFD